MKYLLESTKKELEQVNSSLQQQLLEYKDKLAKSEGQVKELKRLLNRGRK